MKRRARKRGQCVYCGSHAELSRDHVVPRCLFTPPYPENLITVPACDACNLSKSNDDNFLRDLLAIDFEGGQSRSAQLLFSTKISRSAQRNRSELLRYVAGAAKEESFYTRGGLYLGEVYKAPLDEGRMTTLFARMCRGLLYYATNQRIPDSYRFWVVRHHYWEQREILNFIKEFKLLGPFPQGDVFGSICAQAEEDPFACIWLLGFYRKVIFSVASAPSDLMDNDPGHAAGEA
jgi:hypothetical protein